MLAPRNGATAVAHMLDEGARPWVDGGCTGREARQRRPQSARLSAGQHWGTTILSGTHMNNPERQGSETDLRAIDLVRNAHVNALNAGDANAWTAQFTDDGVQMPPNAPANTGRARISSWSQGLLGQFHVQFALAVEEIRVLGE